MQRARPHQQIPADRTPSSAHPAPILRPSCAHPPANQLTRNQSNINSNLPTQSLPNGGDGVCGHESLHYGSREAPHCCNPLCKSGRLNQG